MTIRWQCDQSGCYKDRCIPDWGCFDDCFPGSITIGDVDGLVEKNGYGLLIEWKSGEEHWPDGKVVILRKRENGEDGAQEIMYKNLTRRASNLTVCVVAGSTKTMEVRYIAWFRNGQYYEPEKASLEKLQEYFTYWVKWAESQ